MNCIRLALSGVAALLLSCPSFAQLGADECVNADDLGIGSTSVPFDTNVCTDTGAPATTSAEMFHCFISDDVWFEWTASATGVATFDTCTNPTFDSELTVWHGSDCATMSWLGCNDDGPGCMNGSSVTLVVTAGTKYWIQLGYWAFSGSAWGAGTLTITEAPSPCDSAPDDALEDNDTCATAVPGALGATHGLHCDLDDPDFFSYPLAAGERIQFGVVEPDQSIDLRQRVYGPTCVVLAGTNSNAIFYTAPTAGVYVVEVFVNPQFVGIGCTSYTTSVSVAPDPCFGPPDALEENDFCSAAVPLADGVYTGLDAATSDTDYYALCVPDQGTLILDLLFTHTSAGNLNMYLYEAGSGACEVNENIYFHGPFGALTYSDSQDDDEQIVWTNTTGATVDYILEVNLAWPGCNDYELVVSGTCPVGPTLACDPAQPHSAGTWAKLDTSSATGPGVYHLECTDGPGGGFGYFLVSSILMDPGVAVSNGFLCLGAPVGRYSPAAGGVLDSVGQFDASGVFQSATGNSQVGSGYDVFAALPTPPGGTIDPGSTWHFQCWYRDGQRSNFSNVASVTFP